MEYEGYQLYWLDVTTGRVGAPITAASCTWDIELNKTESISMTVHKSGLPTITPRLYTPPTGGVLLTHTGRDGIEYPIIAGPVIDWGTETRTTLEVKAAGLRWIFEHRTIWENLEFKGTTLGEIAWALAAHGMARPGGALPLVHGTLADSGGRQRTYEAWNVANNTIAKRWSELSQVQRGPDIMIRPRFTDTHHHKIEWVFMHGTEQYPFIAQGWAPDFDTTPAACEIADVRVTSSGKDIVNRVWYTGAGEGPGTAIAYAENLAPLAAGAPYLEAVLSDADQADPRILREKAAGVLAVRQQMVDQVTLEFPANSRKTPLGSFFVGDTAVVTLTGWLTVPDGSRDMRIIKMSGSLDPEVTLDFQEVQAW